MITEQQARDFIDLLESNKYTYIDISVYLEVAIDKMYLIDFKSKTASQIIDELDQIRKKYKDLDVDDPKIKNSIPKNIADLAYFLNENFERVVNNNTINCNYRPIILETLGFFRFHGKESALNTKYIEKLMRFHISNCDKNGVRLQYAFIKTTRLGITALSDSAIRLLKNKKDLDEYPFQKIYSNNLYVFKKKIDEVSEIDRLFNYLLTFGFDSLIEQLNDYEIKNCAANKLKCYVTKDSILKMSNYRHEEIISCIEKLVLTLNKVKRIENSEENNKSIINSVIEDALNSKHVSGIVNMITTKMSTNSFDIQVKNKIDSEIENLPSEALEDPNFTPKMTEGYRKNWNSQPNPYILSKIYTEKRVREYISSIKHLNILHEAFSEDTIKYLVSLGLSKDDFKVDKTEIIVEYNLRYDYDYGYGISQFSNPYTKTYKSFFKEDYYEIFKNLATSSKDFGVLRMLIGKSTDEIKEAGELFREGLLVWTFNFQNTFKDTRVLIQYSNVLKYFKCRVKNLQNIFPKVFKIKD